MLFEIQNNSRENITSLVRLLGYKPIGYSDRGELNCVRPLMGQPYPRFHLYIAESPARVRFSLHLDQKRPSYEGATAHSGDYESDIVKEEGKRIQELAASSKPARKNPFAP